MPKVSSACASFRPPRPTYGMIGRDAARRRRRRRPACRPWSRPGRSTLTWPARISARARSRDGARPRVDDAADRGGCLGIGLRSRVSNWIDPGAVTDRHRSIRSLDDPSADVRAGASRRGRRSQRRSRARAGSRRPSLATRRGRRAPGTSACPRRRPCPAVLPSAARRAFDVEDVVDDLKREAELGRRGVDRRHLRGRCRRP